MFAHYMPHLLHVEPKMVHNGGQAVTPPYGVTVASVSVASTGREGAATVACPRLVRVQIEGSATGWVA
jgi:hypothetical protein